jgi:hypothetical protein
MKVLYTAGVVCVNRGRHTGSEAGFYEFFNTLLWLLLLMDLYWFYVSFFVERQAIFVDDLRDISCVINNQSVANFGFFSREIT